MSIYVEARIRGDLAEVWEKTQDPARHERWDLRFTRISYLPRPDESQPQRFLYETRIGFGLKIEGTGETVGEKAGPNGERSSALKFWSDDPKSLIREGGGFWKYVPVGDGSVRFFTEYRYETRYGAVGALFNRLAFEPVMGWATAWSFDRLRLWIETGIDPAVSLRFALAHGLSRLTLAFVFLYHGLVPKLLLRHPDEVTLVARGGVPEALIPTVVGAVGVAEVVFALLLLGWHSHWPLILTVAGMVFALAGVALTAPTYLGAAFNPVTLNVSLIALALVGLLTERHAPSAARCSRRRPPKVVP
jgi:hypothetical protein